ncbi:MAG: beta-lactamase family protein [Granulosicoccus sp.]|nr:beta-lactamase family protein [Granulosicoccus sp.]
MNSSPQLGRIISNLRSATAFRDQYSKPSTLMDRMAQLHTPAVSLAVIQDFEITESGSFGICKVGASKPATQDTLFQAGSISKPVFAAAVMSLVQDKVLDLDEDINHYLKSWKVPSNRGWQPRITLRQLLSHTAGTTVHGFPGYQSTEQLPTLQQILNGERPSNTPKVEVNILPGLQFRYSGGGTTVAQLAVMEHLGETYPELMKRLVFDPLGMNNSTFENPLPAGLVVNSAVAHPAKSIPLTGGHHIYPEAAAAGLWTTATDLATFGLAMLNSLHGQETAFLNQDTIRKMLEPQLPQERGKDEFIGLGFFCEDNNGDPFFGHSGWDAGFVAELKLYQRGGRGAVVMINSNEGHQLIGELMRAVADEYGWGAAPEIESTVSLSDLGPYIGQYQTEQSQLFHIRESTGGLTLQYDHQSPLDFKPSSEQLFYSPELNSELSFEFDAEGNVLALTIQQSDLELRAIKS